MTKVSLRPADELPLADLHFQLRTISNKLRGIAYLVGADSSEQGDAQVLQAREGIGLILHDLTDDVQQIASELDELSIIQTRRNLK